MGGNESTGRRLNEADGTENGDQELRTNEAGKSVTGLVVAAAGAAILAGCAVGLGLGSGESSKRKIMKTPEVDGLIYKDDFEDDPALVSGSSASSSRKTVKAPGRDDFEENTASYSHDLVADQMRMAVEETMAASFQEVPSPILVSWQPPSAGCYILNTDGAVKKSSGLASAGGLIRDSKGDWVGGFVTNIGSTVTDIFMAELWGVREGLLLARELKLSQVIVELDATSVVSFLKGNIDNSHSGSVPYDAISLVREGWVKEVRHIYREGNKCADFLANLAQSYSSGTSVLFRPPSNLLRLLETDKQGNPVMRT